MLASLMEIDQSISRHAITWFSEARIPSGILAPFLGNPLVKGAVPAAVFWYLWFRADNLSAKRPQLIATLLVAVAAIILGRILQAFLPFRQRPRGSMEIMGDDAEQTAFLQDWSSMPSDHALMFFALAACIFMISRFFGILLFLHAAFGVCLARVAFGMHYSSDVVVGAVIGTTLAFVLMPGLTRWVQRQYDTGHWTVTPQVGYPLLFLVTFQFATMFDGARDLAGRLARFLF